MEVVKFDKPIVYYGGNKNNSSYAEALVTRLQIDFIDYQRLLEMSNMPLLYIGNYRYAYFTEENGNGKNQKILTFHIVNWRDLQSGMPMSYTMNHENPHTEKAIKFNTKLIKNRE